MKFPDVSRLLFLPRKKEPPLSPFGAPYATFQARLLAVTIDVALLVIVLAPLSQWITTALYGPLAIDMEAIRQAAQEAQTVEERQAIVRGLLGEAGYFRHWAANFLIQTGGLALYMLLMWRAYGATLGKLLMGLRIVDAKTGEPMAARQAVLRLTGYVIAAVPALAGFIWIGLDARRQGWHDKLAGTVVVKTTKG